MSTFFILLHLYVVSEEMLFEISFKERYIADSMGQSPLEKLILTQLVKKFLTFYETRSFIAVFTTAFHLSYPEPDAYSSHTSPLYFPKIHLILSTNLSLCLPSGLSLFRFPGHNFVFISHVLYACYTHSLHFPLSLI
jgi:hypothetical protein